MNLEKFYTIRVSTSLIYDFSIRVRVENVLKPEVMRPRMASKGITSTLQDVNRYEKLF